MQTCLSLQDCALSIGCTHVLVFMVQNSFRLILRTLLAAALMVANSCGNRTKNTAFQSSSAEGQVIWKVAVGEVDWCSPAIGSDGAIYQGDLDGNLFAINPDGSIRWRKVFAGADLAESSPTLTPDGKRMYFGTHNSPGKVYCVEPSNGNIIWTYTIPNGGGGIVSSAAIGADGTIYIGTGDWFEGNPGDIGDDRFFAINPDGTLKWIFRDPENTGTERTSFFANAAIGFDGTIYIGSFKGYFYALRDAGNKAKVKWKFATKNDNGRFEEIWSSAAIDADGTIYFGSNNGKLYALKDKGTTYELKWEFKTYAEVWASPVIGPDGTIYISSEDTYLYAINPDGTEKWRYKDKDNKMHWFGTAAIASDGTMIFGGEHTNFYTALNPDGTLKWKTKVLGKDETRTSPNIVHDGTIYLCGGVSGVLYAIKGPGPLADTAWPKMQRDLKNTGYLGFKR
jgi:outer membrane protein assembly factor BamB